MKKNLIKLSVLAFGFTSIISLSSCKNSESDSKENTEATEEMDMQDETTDNSYPTNATAEYLTYVERGGDLDDNMEQKLYTKEALNKLAAAVEEKSQDLNAKPNDSLNSITAEIDGNTNEIDTTITADNLYSKGQVIVGVLENLQKDSYPELSDEVMELKESWKKLKAAKKTDYKDANVSAFFDEAADLLEDMVTETPNGNVSASYTGKDSTLYSKKADTIEVDQ
ncbi:hypothetical protein [Zunongwangia sp. HGR-M22]|uniref:hypothetical protein n=1 Tax=Zunongwangia sp. HGR-M22 TaxID=3015168 RepID=UPI0022DCFC11|nr:hypothetical protein [Zunongwangia sp. HGR-M22]WBL25290.1 hypothetical protein PBT91_15495 [Zunongwangia sp. HGR-M22]